MVALASKLNKNEFIEQAREMIEQERFTYLTLHIKFRVF